MTVGQRAYMEMQAKVSEEGISISQECRNLGINSSTAQSWQKGRSNPSSYPLQQMALMGYDVIYILTGEKTS